MIGLFTCFLIATYAPLLLLGLLLWWHTPKEAKHD